MIKNIVFAAIMTLIGLVSLTSLSRGDQHVPMSDRPHVHFDTAEWVMINDDAALNSQFWIKNKGIECDRQYCAPVAMIRFKDVSKKIPGVGEEVRKIYSESIVDCDRQILYPIRDIYTTDDDYVVNVNQHPKDKGTMSARETGTMAYAAYLVACKGEIPKVKK